MPYFIANTRKINHWLSKFTFIIDIKQDKLPLPIIKP